MNKSRTIDIIIPIYNSAPTISKSIRYLLELPVTEGWQVKIIIVDDGSTNSTATLIKELFKSPQVRLLRLSQNRGRAAARDFGAKTSAAEFLLFIDGDCTPERSDYLQVAIKELEDNTNLAFGPIGSIGNGFWARYLEDVEKKRNLHATGNQWVNAITSANLLVERSYYNNAGGFNPEYKHYGFEDRDLIIRLLSTSPRISYLSNMRVYHNAKNTVKEYCAKMETAARYSAPLFFRDHPQQYQKLSYAILDSTTNNSLWIYILRKISGRLKRQFIAIATILATKQYSPYALTKCFVRAASAISYIHGTTQRDNDRFTL